MVDTFASPMYERADMMSVLCSMQRVFVHAYYMNYTLLIMNELNFFFCSSAVGSNSKRDECSLECSLCSLYVHFSMFNELFATTPA